MADIDINALTIAHDIDDSGSKKWMAYTSDTDDLYAVFINEDIGEALGFIDITSANDNIPVKPAGLEMRVINCVSANGKVRARYPCGAPSEEIYSEGGTIKVPRKGSATGLVLTVTGVTGEKRRIIGANDSGQGSGDIS
jgi:hypothetical protein